MPTHTQGTIEIANPTDRGMGSSSTNDLKTMFASSGVNTGKDSAESVRHEMQAVLDDVINDGGHTFPGGFDPNYETGGKDGAPDYGDVPTGGGGDPASAWAPNPTSPGEGSVSPTDQPKAPDGFGETPSDTPFAGVGSQLSPKASSAKISAQTLGDYMLGKSSS